MKRSFSIHHPCAYDPCSLIDATIQGPVLIAWGDCPPDVPFSRILGVLRTANPDAKAPIVLKGTTYVAPPPPPPGGAVGQPPQMVWAVIFPEVPVGKFVLEVWKTCANGKLAALLGSVGPVRRQLVKDLTLVGPGTGSTVYSNQFFAGGEDTDYLAVTSTFWNGANSYHGVEVHRGKPTEQYWVHTFTNVAPGPGYSCSATNGVHTTNTNTGIGVIAAG